MSSKIDTIRLKRLLHVNRISVRDFGADIFPKDDYRNQEAKATRVINNRYELTTPLIKSISELLRVKPEEFLVQK